MFKYIGTRFFYKNKLYKISIPGDEILDSDWLTAVHYLSIMVPPMIVYLWWLNKSVKRQFSLHKRVFFDAWIFKCRTSKTTYVMTSYNIDVSIYSCIKIIASSTGNTKTLIWTQPRPLSKIVCFRAQYWAPASPSPNIDHGSILFFDNGLGFVQ